MITALSGSGSTHDDDDDDDDDDELMCGQSVLECDESSDHVTDDDTEKRDTVEETVTFEIFLL